MGQTTRRSRRPRGQRHDAKHWSADHGGMRGRWRGGGDGVVADIAARSGGAYVDIEHPDQYAVALQNLKAITSRNLDSTACDSSSVRMPTEYSQAGTRCGPTYAHECRHGAGHSCRGGDPMRNNKRLAAAAACLFLALAGCGGSGSSGPPSGGGEPPPGPDPTGGEL